MALLTPIRLSGAEICFCCSGSRIAELGVEGDAREGIAGSRAANFATAGTRAWRHCTGQGRGSCPHDYVFGVLFVVQCRGVNAPLMRGFFCFGGR